MNLDEKTTVIIKPNKKDLPFKGGNQLYSEDKKNIVLTKKFTDIGEVLKQINEGTKIKTVIIEDLTHYFTYRLMIDAKLAGYQKWTDLGIDVFNALFKIEEGLRDDLNIIVIGHVDRSSDLSGNQIITLQTPGKLLENQIKIPSYFTYVLHTDVVQKPEGGNDYRFLTNSDGVKVAKSPEGCLETYEPNDYRLIMDKIDKYQNAK